MNEKRNLAQSMYYLGAISEVRQNWQWFLFFGILLALAGIGAMYASAFTTHVTLVLLGAILVGGGIVELVSSFWAQRWSGFFLSAFLGVLYAVLGAVILSNPAISAVTLTLVMALAYMISGIFRIVGSLTMRFENWSWHLFSGLVAFVIGLLIWAQWPYTGLWIIGFFVGLDMLLTGLTWVFLSLSAKNYKVLD